MAVRGVCVSLHVPCRKAKGGSYEVMRLLLFRHGYVAYIRVVQNPDTEVIIIEHSKAKALNRHDIHWRVQRA